MYAGKPKIYKQSTMIFFNLHVYYLALILSGSNYLTMQMILEIINYFNNTRLNNLYIKVIKIN